jgi:hypothetical protein
VTLAFLSARTGGEQQVAAVFRLVNRVAVAEAAAPLFTKVAAEAQAGGIDLETHSVQPGVFRS